MISPKSICIHAPLHLGDSVMSLPLAQSVKAHFPKSRVVLLAKREFADLWQDQPCVDKVLKWDPTQEKHLRSDFISHSEEPFGVMLSVSEASQGKLRDEESRSQILHSAKQPFRVVQDDSKTSSRLCQMLKNGKFDLSLILATGKEIALAHAKAKIPVRIGYDFWGRKPFLTHFIPTNGFPTDPKLVRRHMVQNYLNLLRLISIWPRFVQPKLVLSEKSKICAARILEKLGLNAKNGIVGLAPGARYGPSKRWPMASYLNLAVKISKELGVKIVWFGCKGDRVSLGSLEGGASLYGINLIGTTELDEVMGLIAQCKLVVSNDSGISHVANALDIPTVTLFGSTSPTWTRPLNPQSEIVTKKLACSPCFQSVCPLGHTRCLKEISVENVFRSMAHLLRKIDSPTRVPKGSHEKQENNGSWAMAMI